MIVEVDYGVEPPRVVLERTSVPIYAQVGGGVRYETVMVGVDSRGNPIYRTVAVYEPSRTELIGYQEMVTPSPSTKSTCAFQRGKTARSSKGSRRPKSGAST